MLMKQKKQLLHSKVILKTIQVDSFLNIHFKRIEKMMVNIFLIIFSIVLHTLGHTLKLSYASFDISLDGAYIILCVH